MSFLSQADVGVLDRRATTHRAAEGHISFQLAADVVEGITATGQGHYAPIEQVLMKAHKLQG
jgi:hypothetical protein